MNKLLIRGGLSRATHFSGRPLLRTSVSVRHQSSEEVAQERQAEDDDVEAGNAANALASNGRSLQQARGPNAYRGKGVAPSQRQHWYNEATTQPQNILNGEDHFSRSGRVAAARPATAAAAAATAAAASAAGARRGSPSSADFSPLSRVAPVAGRDEDGRQIVNVNGAGKQTSPVSRNVSSRLSNRGHNNSNSSRSRSNSNGQARGTWDITLDLKGVGTGGNIAAQMREPSVVDAANAGAAAGRSDPLRPYPAPNGASILKVGNGGALCCSGCGTRARRKWMLACFAVLSGTTRP